MAIEFRGVRFPPLRDLTVSAPNGAVIGVIGEKGAGKAALLRLASGAVQPEAGEVIAEGQRRYLGPLDALATFARERSVDRALHGAARRLERARAVAGIDRLRSAGTTVLIVSHELDLLQSLCDEVWWLDARKTAATRRSARRAGRLSRAASRKRLRACGATLKESTGASQAAGRWPRRDLSHRDLGQREEIQLLFCGAARTRRCGLCCVIPNAVEEPVIGIMLRTRIGLEVYGTNTELEKVSTGTCAAGSRMQIEFAFRCDLCPGEYTITLASHDANGTTHDWVDDAVMFTVADSRYTAGVANLRATSENRYYFCSRMNVGAMPDSVEKPDGPIAVSQLEQPCTLPR